MGVEARAYLAATPVIDWQAPEILAQAATLRDGLSDPLAIARTAFEWVRDEIKHSVDYGLEPVSCSASEVLRLGSGFCYGKSHLLAALLRADGIPAGLCYQRLSIDGVGAPFCLHGLNAVYLDGHGWYRLDPRGNKPGVNAQFAPPREQLAFKVSLPGEHDYARIWVEPAEVVVEVLRRYSSVSEVSAHLPDMPPLG
jgi:transglutaminase-like putative cysteine protease